MTCKVLLVAALAIPVASCVTSTGSVNFEKHGVFAHKDAGNNRFHDVKMVSGSKSSWSFASCDDMAYEAVSRMVAEAKAAGAATVYEVRFIDRNGKYESLEPLCRRRFGLLALFLIPYWSSISVRGMAANLIGDAQPAQPAQPPAAQQEKVTPELIQKAKKCSAKGGIFINGGCQISVE